MLNLVKNELLKIFTRKSTYIVLFIVTAFIILNNFIYKNSNTKDLKEETSVESLLQEVEFLENNNNVGIDYLRKTAQIKIVNYHEAYNESWQTYVIENIIKNTVDSMILEGSISDKRNLIEILDEYEGKIESADWKWFLNFELKHYSLMLEDVGIDAEERDILKLKQKWSEYRLKHEINYDETSSDMAIRKNIEANVTLIRDRDNLTKYECQELEREAAISEFVATHNIDYYNQCNSNNYLLDMFYDYQILVVIILLVLCGTIVSSEVSEKTIKNLLIKPYTRTEILLSKYLTSMIILIFSIGYIFVTQYLIGNIIFGYTSLFEEIGIIYNYHTQAVSIVSNIHYLFIELLQFLPFFLIIISIFIVIGCLTFNNTLSVTIPLLLIFFSNTINSLVVNNNIKFMKYFITLNWDLTEVFFGKIPRYSYMSLKGSLLISSAYIFIFIILSFISFNKKDIRNI